jgi:pimeloyl-ACP methyl ester carboxylesterase
MTIHKNYIFTTHGARLQKISGQNTAASSNYLFIPCPGLGSESLIDLVLILDGKIDACLWLMDHPNDGDNLNPNYDFANWSQSIIEAVTILDKPIVVAHSTSGMMLQSIPELEHIASGMVLIASAPDMSWKDTFTSYMQQNLTAELKLAAQAHSIHPNNESLRELLLAAIQFSFEPSSFNAARKMLGKLLVNHKVAEYSDLNFDPIYKAKFVPNSLATLIINGKRDKIIPSRVYIDKQKYIRDNILIKQISGASHYPWFEKPDAVLNAFIEFKSKFYA